MPDSSGQVKILKVSDVFLPEIEQTAMNEWTISGGDLLDVSDEYHTMSDLYEHRMALNIALFNHIAIYQKYPGGPEVLKSKLHSDGTMFEGYFIVVYNFHFQFSYHYDLKYWDLFKIPEVERVPWEYDGHTSKDVIERLLKL